jgi:hypothetical protein
VEQRVRSVDEALASFERFVQVRETSLGATSMLERRLARNDAAALVRRLMQRLPHTVVALREATAALAVPRAARTRVADDAGGEHCLACGAACTGARFCPACGTRCAETRRCRRCQHVLRMPVHLLVPAGAEGAHATHCAACGELHTT